MRFSELTKGRTKELAVSLHDQTFNITYDPSKFTPSLQSKLKNVSDNAEALIENMLVYIVGWDVKDENDDPYPFTADALLNLPFEVHMAMNKAITDDFTPPR